MDIGVKDGKMVGVRGRAVDRVNKGRRFCKTFRSELPRKFFKAICENFLHDIISVFFLPQPLYDLAVVDLESNPARLCKNCSAISEIQDPRLAGGYFACRLCHRGECPPLTPIARTPLLILRRMTQCAVRTIR